MNTAKTDALMIFGLLCLMVFAIQVMGQLADTQSNVLNIISDINSVRTIASVNK